MYPRLRVLGPAVCCALAILSTPAVGATRTAANPRPQALWQAYPLTSSHETTPSGVRATPTTRPVASTAPAAITTTGRSPTRRIIVVVAAVVVGIVLGLIPALIIGVVVGVIPWPRRLRRRSALPATSVPTALKLPDDDANDPDAELYFGGKRYRVEDLRRTISARLATDRDGR